MKLWSGRFRKETDALVNDFNSSIPFDQRLYREDIEGSMAHASMLGEQGIISRADAENICTGLRGILADVEAGTIEFSADNEDIHMNVETILTARIGEAGKRLHTARSRNDQVALDFRAVPAAADWRDCGAAAAFPEGAAAAGQTAHGDGHARLHSSAAGSAHHLCPSSAGLCPHALPGRDAAGGLSRA